MIRRHSSSISRHGLQLWNLSECKQVCGSTVRAAGRLHQYGSVTNRFAHTGQPTSGTDGGLRTLTTRIEPRDVSKRSYSVSEYKATSEVANFAFAFDIDGVLLREQTAFSNAIKALRFLTKHKIPFILLTNGGGKHETERVKDLSSKFGVDLTVENFVQSHTPFQELVAGSESQASLKDKTILVTGGEQDRCRAVAQQYGFQKVVTPGDIITQIPTIWPFNQIWTDYYQKIAKPLSLPVDYKNTTKPLKIDAIFVYNDPRDWGLDCQIILDLLLSHQGILGTYSEQNGNPSLPNNGWQQDGQPPLYFSNPDLFWSAAYHLPRLGQGGFRAALEGLWATTTNGAELKRTVIGKPYAKTYDFAEKMLQEYRRSLLGAALDSSKPAVPALERVFMVGDNPESDIRGANDFESPTGAQWTSVLVETGVHQSGTTPKYKPKAVVPDVLAAVQWALTKEGYVYEEDDFNSL